jgi:flagellar assembly protein FliH
MSSDIARPGDPRSPTPITWRRVGSPATGIAALPEMAAPASAVPLPAGANLEERIKQAYASGMREGEAAGRSRAAAELQPVLERLQRSIAELAGLRARFRREAETDLIRLALAIARRILRRELAVDPDAIHGLVLAALEKLQGQEICRVRVHPAHAGIVSGCLRQVAAAAAVEVLPDASRELGTVIFETERGNLDASVESQLREIERGLSDRLGGSR